MWDSRACSKHYKKEHYPMRLEIEAGQHNDINVPLIPANKIILPFLHIKLGLFKKFVKALDKESEVFNLLRTCFPRLSIAKIKEGVFVGPEMRKLMLNEEFNKMLNINQLKA